MARRAARRGSRGGAVKRPEVERRPAREQRTASPPLADPRGSLVMRKCACGSGGGAGLDDKCAKCRSKPIQRKAAEPAGRGFDVGRLAIGVSAPGDPAEREADRAATHAGAAIAGAASGLAPGPPPVLSAFDGAVHRAPPGETPTTASGFIVEDDTELLAAGQMRKLDFLAELRRESCDAADRVLREVGRSTDGCPLVAKWIDYYTNRPAELVERALQKYAPETRFAASARGYIPLVSARIARGVQSWAITGRLPDLPPELAGAMAGGNSIVAVASAVAGMVGQLGRAIGGLFRKAPDAGAPATGAVDRGAVHDRLGAGEPLAGGVKAQMEDAFGHGFGDVRVHADADAAGVARDLDARAFTVGSHVAFAGGEYRPGTVAGDALIAHELAHVVQQTGGTAARADGKHGVDVEPDAAAEHDADAAAVDALVHARGGGKRRAGVARRGRGPSLQRCGGSDKKKSADKLAETRLPDAAGQKEMLAELGVDTGEAPIVAGTAIEPPVGEAKPSERVIEARTQWDGIPAPPTITDAKAASNRAAMIAEVRTGLDGYIGLDKVEKPKKTFPLTEYEGPCQAAKNLVDEHFADWIPAGRKGFEFHGEGVKQNIFSSFDLDKRREHGVPTPSASGRIIKFLQSNDKGQKIARDHFFQMGRSDPEKLFFAEMVAELLKDKDLEARLLAYSTYQRIARPSSDHKSVFLPNDSNTTGYKWQVVGICAHEYIHNLAHPAFKRATGSASSDVASEGFTHMLTREVMSRVLQRAPLEPSLREQVQGDDSPADLGQLTAFIAKLPSAPYNDVTNAAERVRDTAGGPKPKPSRCGGTPGPRAGGLNAVKAAFFLGHVELIGLAPDGKPGPIAQRDSVAIPPGVTTLDQLAVASGVPVEEILQKNPSLKADSKLEAGKPVVLPGCRTHVVVNDEPDAATAVTESKSAIAALNGIAADDLDRANPGVTADATWDALTPGQHLLIPRHK
jgi:hypothetical protein